MCAGIRPTTGAQTHTHAKGDILTHTSESVLQDHTGSAVTGSVNMSEGVF